MGTIHLGLSNEWIYVESVLKTALVKIVMQPTQKKIFVTLGAFFKFKFASLKSIKRM